MCEKTSNGCDRNPPLTDEAIQKSGLPFNTRTLKHHLDLMLAHQIRPHATTFHDEWIMTDYIFYTKFKRRSSNVRRMPQYSCLQLLKRLDPPTIKECSQIGKIPNKGIPSDHFFLAAEFVLMFYRWQSRILSSPFHSWILYSAIRRIGPCEMNKSIFSKTLMLIVCVYLFLSKRRLRFFYVWVDYHRLSVFVCPELMEFN